MIPRNRRAVGGREYSGALAAPAKSKMTNNLYDLDPGPECPRVVWMIVEIPKHSTNKYEYDAERNLFRLDRPMYSPVHYPGEYGFIPGTVAKDGDPVDILTLVDEPSYPGTLIAARPLGVLRMIDQRKPDAKILAVADRNPAFSRIQRADQLFPHTLREVEHFFEIYKQLEGKKTKVGGWRGPREAYAIITRAREMYLKNRRPSSHGSA